MCELIEFLCPRTEWTWWMGAYCFVLSVCLFLCLSDVNFNLRFNFWTIKDRVFILGMRTPLMTPFKWYQRQWPCDLDSDLWVKIQKTYSFFFATRGIMFTNTCIFCINFVLWLNLMIFSLKKRSTILLYDFARFVLSRLKGLLTFAYHLEWICYFVHSNYLVICHTYTCKS